VAGGLFWRPAGDKTSSWGTQTGSPSQRHGGQQVAYSGWYVGRSRGAVKKQNDESKDLPPHQKKLCYICIGFLLIF
jgi:hypothetical protein